MPAPSFPPAQNFIQTQPKDKRRKPPILYEPSHHEKLKNHFTHLISSVSPHIHSVRAPPSPPTTLGLQCNIQKLTDAAMLEARLEQASILKKVRAAMRLQVQVLRIRTL